MMYDANDDFKDFLIRNGIVTTAAAITIGIASATFIKGFVADIMMPAFYFVVGKLLLQNVSNRMYKSVTDIFGDKAEFNFDGFLKDFVTWGFIVFAAFLIIEYVVRRWFLGLHKKGLVPPPAQLTMVTPSPVPRKSYDYVLESQQTPQLNTPSQYRLPELGELNRIPMTSGVYSL